MCADFGSRTNDTHYTTFQTERELSGMGLPFVFVSSCMELWWSGQMADVGANHQHQMTLLNACAQRLVWLRPFGQTINAMAPFACHNHDRGGVQSRSDQRVHLCQIATQPAGENLRGQGVFMCILVDKRHGGNYKTVLTTSNRSPPLTSTRTGRCCTQKGRKKIHQG